MEVVRGGRSWTDVQVEPAEFPGRLDEGVGERGGWMGAYVFFPPCLLSEAN